MANIILVGFMGCGKSSIGRFMSTKGYKLIDTDSYIEERENRKIKDIFERNWNALEEIGWNSVLERKAVFVIEVIRDSSGYRSV